MADVTTLLQDAFSALGAIGPPVRMNADTTPGSEEVLVLTLVADTTIPAYGEGPTDTLIQVSSYAQTTLRALQIDSQVRAALRALGLTHTQMRSAPDGDGYISEFK